MAELIPSISYNQHDIIRWIIKLHLDGKRIEVDATYGHGSFYSPEDILEPLFAHDISPNQNVLQHRAVIETNANDLPYSDGSIASIMFDPPFLSKTGAGSIIKDRFGHYPSMKDLWAFYAQALWEFSRILKPDGKLIVKCQNTVMSGRQWWSVNYIKNVASQYGLTLKDEFVLLAKHRMKQHNLKKQRHARKFHCYFLVFEK